MLERLWKRIIRREPYTLWDIPAFLLWLISFGYRFAFWLRRLTAEEPVRVSVPVLSVGNITVGGSGKTPMVSIMARDLLREGIRVGVVSSGYGRSNSDSFIAPGYRVQQMDVGVTSDEVMLLAHQVPEAVFSVDAIKTRAAQKLADSGDVDLIIVDDGFQHHQLARDIDLVTYDAGLKRRWLKPFPYGMLREGRGSLKRADVIVVTRAKFAMARNIIGRERQLPVKYLDDKSVFLFAGVGNFRSLERQVSALSGDLDFALELSDHQTYDRLLLERIKEKADRYDSDLILTTQKDWVKLGDFDFDRESYYLDIAVDLDPGEEKLLAEITYKLNLRKRPD